MSVKRPTFDLNALTSDNAEPMKEASQRLFLDGTPQISVPRAVISPNVLTARSENFEALAFKVSPAFRRRFRSRAVAADLKLNELLVEALDAWEDRRGLKG